MLAAVQPAQAAAPADLSTTARAAVAKSLPVFKFRGQAATSPRSVLDRNQNVKVDSAMFAAGGRILSVVRAVGAERKITARYVPSGRILRTVQVRRPGAGVRTAVLATTADRWGPGLTILAWTERPGVNYQLVARGASSQQELVKLAKALGKDGAKATAKARNTIAKAKPPAPSSVDTRIKQPQKPDRGSVTVQGLSNLTVDGAGGTNDDLGNEATLCNGCSYSSGNYAGMWQHILWADDKLAYSGIDCAFGPGTASATRSWQSSYGLSADGVVGQNTRGKADNYLYQAGGSQVNYAGRVRILNFTRGSNPDYYYFTNGTRISYGNTGSPPGC